MTSLERKREAFTAALAAAREALIGFEERHGLDLPPDIRAALAAEGKVSIFDLPRKIAEFEARHFPAANSATPDAA